MRSFLVFTVFATCSIAHTVDVYKLIGEYEIKTADSDEELGLEMCDSSHSFRLFSITWNGILLYSVNRQIEGQKILIMDSSKTQLEAPLAVTMRPVNSTNSNKTAYEIIDMNENKLVYRREQCQTMWIPDHQEDPYCLFTISKITDRRVGRVCVEGSDDPSELTTLQVQSSRVIKTLMCPTCFNCGNEEPVCCSGCKRFKGCQTCFNRLRKEQRSCSHCNKTSCSTMPGLRSLFGPERWRLVNLDSNTPYSVANIEVGGALTMNKLGDVYVDRDLRNTTEQMWLFNSTEGSIKNYAYPNFSLKKNGRFLVRQSNFPEDCYEIILINYDGDDRFLYNNATTESYILDTGSWRYLSLHTEKVKNIDPSFGTTNSRTAMPIYWEWRVSFSSDWEIIKSYDYERINDLIRRHDILLSDVYS